MHVNSEPACRLVRGELSQQMQCFVFAYRGRCELGFLSVYGTVVSKMAAWHKDIKT